MNRYVFLVFSFTVSALSCFAFIEYVYRFAYTQTELPGIGLVALAVVGVFLFSLTHVVLHLIFLFHCLNRLKGIRIEPLGFVRASTLPAFNLVRGGALLWILTVVWAFREGWRSHMLWGTLFIAAMTASTICYLNAILAYSRLTSIEQ